MLECPGCGANLRFDIERQKMYCSSCGVEYEPTDFPAVSKIRTQTILECPQCGGEMVADDTEAAVFCSYCGASNILTKRMQSESKPFKYILPFQVTKKACKQRYHNWLSRNPFAPQELRDPKNIDSFRAVYMPYWTYSFQRKGTVSVRATRSEYKGDYEYQHIYNATADADIEFSGLNHDASSSFSDNLSEAVAPFHETERKEFAEAYMSGFYADLADVDESLYSDTLKKVTTEASVSSFLTGASSRYYIKRDDVKNAVAPSCVSKDLILLPVWFLCNRIKDNGTERVSYAVINGQTGKVAGDTPISLSRFFTFAGVLSVVLFLVLQIFGLVTINPKTLMVLSCIFSVIMAMIYSDNEAKIRAREAHTDDAGYVYKAKQTQKVSAPQSVTATPVKPKKTLWWIPVVFTGIVFMNNPIQDSVYYSDAVVCMFFVVRLVLMSIFRFNLLCTRPLPQFKRTGGDDSAKN